MLEELSAVQLSGLLKEKNVNVIPIQPNAKIPISSWKQYQSMKYEGEIPDGHNYACLGGQISDNLVIIDIDKIDDKEIINKIYPDALNKTLVVQTGSGGFHIYVRVHKLPNSVKLDKDGIHIDVQAEGKYVVGAGSIHPNGKRYEVISNTTDIAMVDFQEIVVNFERLGFSIEGQAAGLLAAGGIKKGNRHSSAVSYANHFLFYGAGDFNFEMLMYEMERWNKTNVPPLPLEELHQICIDCFKYFKKESEKKSAGIANKDPKDVSIDEWVDEIMSKNSYVTFLDTDEVLYYEDGIYKLDPNNYMIKTECQTLIPKCKSAIVNEIIENIKRRTFVNRKTFDKNPNIINLKNGLFDLKTREVKPHSASYLSMIQLPVEYKPNAVAFGFIKFLKQCLPDPADIILLLEGFANCLLVNSNFEKVFMLIGEGANGKSTYLGIMKAVLGVENISGVSIHELAMDKFAKAELFGKLANIHPDIESNELQGTGVIKGLVSGDLIYAQRKFAHPFNFENKAKLFFSANRFPEVDDQTAAFFRRFFIINWEHQFLENDADPFLKQKIINDPDELSGIFNILLGLIPALVKRKKFRSNNKNIGELRKEWNEKANPIRKFIDEYLHIGNDYWQSKPELYQEYGLFCQNEGVPKESAITFNRFIEKNIPHVIESSKKIDNHSMAVYIGFCLKSKLHIYKQENAEQKKLGET